MKGLSISYDRVIDIHPSLAQKVSEEYNAKRNVIPPQLHCASRENVHIPSSYTDEQPMRGGKPEPTVQAEFRSKEYISIFEEAKDWFELKCLQISLKICHLHHFILER